MSGQRRVVFEPISKQFREIARNEDKYKVLYIQKKCSTFALFLNIFRRKNKILILVYDGFYTHLRQHYAYVLNVKEIQLCCLLCASFSTKEINMLTRQSMQKIYQRKTQVRKKLNLEEDNDIAAKNSIINRQNTTKNVLTLVYIIFLLYLCSRKGRTNSFQLVLTP